jgi:hypothetical protein
VEEVTASAQSLKEMALALQQAVAQFKLPDKTQSKNIEHHIEEPVEQSTFHTPSLSGNNGYHSHEEPSVIAQ